MPPQKAAPSNEQSREPQRDSNRETATTDAPAVDDWGSARTPSASRQPSSDDSSQADAERQSTPADAARPASKAPKATVSPRYRAPGLDNPQPSYPRLARRRGLEGEVVLRVTVSASGAPLAVRVIQTSGASLLDDAAREALAQWRYLPARQGERKVRGTLDVPIRFELQPG